MCKSVVFIFYFFTAHASLGSWSYKESLDTDDPLKPSVIIFKKGNKSQTYKAEREMGGVLEMKEVSIGLKNLLVSMWSRDARSVEYRVFDLSANQIKILCKVPTMNTSFSYKTTDKNISFYQKFRKKDKWVECW